MQAEMRGLPVYEYVRHPSKSYVRPGVRLSQAAGGSAQAQAAGAEGL